MKIDEIIAKYSVKIKNIDEQRSRVQVEFTNELEQFYASQKFKTLLDRLVMLDNLRLQYVEVMDMEATSLEDEFLNPFHRKEKAVWSLLQEDKELCERVRKFAIKKYSHMFSEGYLSKDLDFTFFVGYAKEKAARAQ